jgi:hypothetical protein
MVTFYENYKNFPHTDCGYCGCSSCITALRKFCLGEFDLADCVYFKVGKYREENFFPTPVVNNLWSLKPGITYVLPCAVDPKRTALEVYLSYPENLKYGYFDMITADKIIYLYFPGLGFCPSLGIANLEQGGRAIWGYANGQVLCRLSLDKEDALWQLSRFTRLLWGAVN